MARPYVIVHSMASADGRTDHFNGDVGLYYELAAGLPQDAVLAGSGTMVAAAEEHGITLSGEDAPLAEPAATTGAEPAGAAETAHGRVAETAHNRAAETARDGDVQDSRPLLVVVDAAGLLTRFAWLRAMPYWRDVMVLCAASTPASHLELLARHRVRFLVAGAERVDLAAALTALGERHRIRQVRVDSGGTLNGALLRAGLVDEISIMLGPYVVGGRSPRGLFVADDLPGGPEADDVTRLRLHAVQRLRGDVVWLRYRVGESPE